MPLRLKNKDIPPQTPGKTAMPASSKHPDAQVHQNSVNCPACGYSFITGTNGKRKLRTRVLVFTENGNTMGICPKCKVNLKVPVVFGIRPREESQGGLVDLHKEGERAK